MTDKKTVSKSSKNLPSAKDDLEAFREMFREAGDLLEGWGISELFEMVKGKKTFLLQGDYTIPQSCGSGSINLLKGLEFISLGNALFLSFVLDGTVLLLSGKKNAENFANFSSVFRQMEKKVSKIIDEALSNNNILLRCYAHQESLDHVWSYFMYEVGDHRRALSSIHHYWLIGDQYKRIEQLGLAFHLIDLVDYWLRKNPEVEQRLLVEEQALLKKVEEVVDSVIEKKIVDEKEKNALFRQKLAEEGLIP